MAEQIEVATSTNLTCTTDPGPLHHLFNFAKREERKERKLETPLTLEEQSKRWDNGENLREKVVHAA